MASEVFSREDITLQDGQTVELRPLVIGKLRKFMKIWNEHVTSVAKILAERADDENPDFNAAEAEQTISDLQYDTFIKLCKFGLEELKGEKTEKQFTEYLEDVLDEPTIYKIIEATGGLKLGANDPNLQPGTTPDPDGMN
jgi:hypothetical protein